MNNELLSLTFTALPGIPLIQAGDDLVRIILTGLERANVTLKTGDALVITSKIVSKAEGCLIELDDVVPSDQAVAVATETHKDPRIVEVALQESHSISRKGPGVLVTRHRLGFVSAMSGIDQSNVENGDQRVLLLPHDPDASAETIRAGIYKATGADIGVVISDSHGRPFRMGNVGVAIGVAGMPALVDLRGTHDLFGRELRISVQGYADMVASAANLLTGEAAEGRPVIHVRGLDFPAIHGRAAEFNRPAEQDLYK